jgi:hypothetical protein
VKPAELPPVDADFLIVERDQKKLDAYALSAVGPIIRGTMTSVPPSVDAG